MINDLSSKTQAVVVTYNPDLKLLERNLRALFSQFGGIIVVDNNSKNVSKINELIHDISTKIVFKRLDDNYGIAYAQNVGFRKAVECNFEWLLTMDQDSVIPKNFTSEYERIIKKYNNIGLIAWNQRPYKLGTSSEIEKDWYIISSGCLNNVTALKKSGGFDEMLFIDHVDTDINLRIRNLGYRTITTNNVKLIHEIGVATNRRTLRGAIYHEHSPVRVYYIVRNGIVLFRRYFWKQPGWMLRALINSIREGGYLIYFQPKKMQNLIIVSRAWFDGIFNRLGKFKP